jgi:hypothetical protein
MNVPQPRTEVPNFTNHQPNEELVRLRRRVADLLRLGAATPETFHQTIMQVWQESERRRQSCMQEAEEHLRRYHAMVAQGQGFATVGSILYSVINGFATLEERRLIETAEREKEQKEKEEAAKALAESQAGTPPEESKKKGRRKKAVPPEVTGDAPPAP